MAKKAAPTVYTGDISLILVVKLHNIVKTAIRRMAANGSVNPIINVTMVSTRPSINPIGNNCRSSK
jgi:hypothetical protein